MEEKERQIIHRIIGGETALYEEFVNQYSATVFTLIVRMVENREDAEVLTQETFIKAFQKLDKFKGECAFATWLYRIAYNTTLSALRKRKVETLKVDEGQLANLSDNQVDALLNDESQSRIASLQTALASLSPDERFLITLFYEEEKHLSEITEILGMTENNVKVKLHRIRKKLYLLIKKEEEQ